MDKRLLHYYDRELRYIRELGAEFAKAFPKVAGRLGIEEHSCSDPHVERLFQGYSLLAGRVQQRLDAEFPKLTQALLESVYPSYLGPTPSMAIVQFQPDTQQGSLERGYEIPAGSSLRIRSRMRSGSTCEYRTAHQVRLWPITLESAHYTAVLSELSDLRVPTRKPIRALLRLRLRAMGGRNFSQLGLSALPIHLHGADDKTERLYEALVAHASTLVARWTEKGKPRAVCSTATCSVRPLGFDDEHSLLPRGPRFLQGFRLIQEYLAMPARFHFIELGGLDEARAQCASDTLDVIIPFTEYDPSLEGALESTRIQLYATPAINLFSRTCDLVHPAHDEEPTLLVPDRARPLDFEVHSVQRVTAALPGSTHELELHPERLICGDVQRESGHGFYALERRTRMVSFEEQQVNPRGAHYPGDDVYISLRDRRSRLTMSGRPQLRAQALCTNRDLPMQLDLSGETPFTTPSGAPVRGVRCLAGPTMPYGGVREGADSWALINHLSQNYLALSDENSGGEALREVLQLCIKRGDPQLQRDLEAIRSVVGKTIIGPIPGPGPRQFTRGLEVTLSCEERAVGGQRAFLLAGVLSTFFARHASTHSFTVTVLHTLERGEVHRWPAVAGLRRAI